MCSLPAAVPLTPCPPNHPKSFWLPCANMVAPRPIRMSSKPRSTREPVLITVTHSRREPRCNGMGSYACDRTPMTGGPDPWPAHPDPPRPRTAGHSQARGLRRADARRRRRVVPRGRRQTGPGHRVSSVELRGSAGSTSWVRGSSQGDRLVRSTIRSRDRGLSRDHRRSLMTLPWRNADVSVRLVAGADLLMVPIAATRSAVSLDGNRRHVRSVVGGVADVDGVLPRLGGKGLGAVIPDAEGVVRRRWVDGDRHRLRRARLHEYLRESDESLGGLSRPGDAEIYPHHLGAGHRTGICYGPDHGHRRMGDVRRVDRYVG